MKKRLLIIALCLCCILIYIAGVLNPGILPLKICSPERDTRLDIRIKGLENERYYITLLCKDGEESVGGVDSEPIKHYVESKDRKFYDTSWEKFRNYKDADGYYFTENVYMNKDSNEYYFCQPPKNYKVLIYVAKQDKFVTSGTMELDSKTELDLSNKYKFTLAKDKVNLVCTRNFNYIRAIMFMLIALLLTVGAKIVVALLFGLGQKKIMPFIIKFDVVIYLFILAVPIIVGYNSVYSNANLCCLVTLVPMIIEYLLYFLYIKELDITRSIKKWVIPTYIFVACIISPAVIYGVYHMFAQIIHFLEI